MRLCLVLFAALFYLAVADYGREEKDIGPPQPQKQNALEKRDDDGSIHADDASLERLNKEREELAGRLKRMDSLKARLKIKNQRLKHVQALRGTLKVATQRKEKGVEEEHLVAEGYRISLKKKNATWDEKEHIADERRAIQTNIEKVGKEQQKFDQELANIESKRKATETSEQELKAQHKQLIIQINALMHKFKDDGFQIWLQRNLEKLPPVAHQTVIKMTEALDPVLGGVKGVADINEHITRDTTDVITQLLPTVKANPFYTGLIFYIILLFPIVVVTWLVMKIRARLSMLTIEHYLIAINMYFGILSLVCTVMTLVGKTDILIIFRHRSQHLAETFMILHGFLFVIHLILHGITAYMSGSRRDYAQYVVVACIGLHFFMNAYKRTILNQDANVGAPAYIIYAVSFMYILYDRGVHILEAAVKDSKARISDFQTYPSISLQKLPISHPQSEGRDSTVYFAGLPVYNAPAQMSLEDAKNI